MTPLLRPLIPESQEIMDCVVPQKVHPRNPNLPVGGMDTQKMAIYLPKIPLGRFPIPSFKPSIYPPKKWDRCQKMTTFKAGATFFQGPSFWESSREFFRGKKNLSCASLVPGRKMMFFFYCTSSYLVGLPSPQRKLKVETFSREETTKSLNL